MVLAVMNPGPHFVKFGIVSGADHAAILERRGRRFHDGSVNEIGEGVLPGKTVEKFHERTGQCAAQPGCLLEKRRQLPFDFRQTAQSLSQGGVVARAGGSR